METTEAKRLIEDLFSNKFNENKFINFANNLLHSAQFDPSDIPISKNDSEHIKSLKRLATYEDPNGKKLDLLIVSLLKDTSLEKARTMQRNFVANYLKNTYKEAALIAFFHSQSSQWRFSLIKMDLGFEGANVIENFTPSKRWSFLVGENEGTHTAKKQLVEILSNKKDSPTLEDLEQSFSVEKVTDEFFYSYTNLFHELKESLDEILEKDKLLKKEFEEKDIDTSDFAKKTLGQIAFLYFLQKKGWFGVARGKEWGTGVKNFIREVFERRKKYGKNFFDDVLEPLFYEALAKDRGIESIYTKLNNCRIPFLNGGLFEPMNGYSWETTNIRLSDKIFSNNHKTKNGDIGNGILDVFDRYNFTVNEFEPLDQEVAVDPEMLGKVFENLLGKKERSDKGAFYTPRKIVKYMCKESLINYLKIEINDESFNDDIRLLIQSENIDEKDLFTNLKKNHLEKLDKFLTDIKICDPAVGSGAFPVGMLNEIVSARSLIATQLNKPISAQDIKLHAIANSLYGVDIDPGAIEIAKLRLWLSLVVEEDNPRPLPNLEFKIMQGDSLRHKYGSVELFDDDFLRRSELIDDEKKLIENEMSNLTRELNTLYKSGKLDSSKKAEITKQAKKLRKRRNSLTNNSNKNLSLFEESEAIEVANQKAELLQLKVAEYLSTVGQTPKENLKSEIDFLKWDLIEATLSANDDEDQLPKIKALRKQRIKPFFVWKLEFAEVFKSKGGFDLIIANPPYNQLQKSITDDSSQKYADLYKDLSYETFDRTGDLYVLFFELGINLLKSKGHLNYITSNKWVKSGYGKALRNFILKFNPKFILDFAGHKVFDTPTVDVNLLMLNKENNQNEVQAAVIEPDYSKDDNLFDYFEKNKIKLNNLDQNEWFIGSQDDLNLKHKIIKKGTALLDWDISIYRGILSGFKKGFIIPKSKKEELEKKSNLNEAIIKPVLEGKDIGSYDYKFNDLYLIATHNGFIDNLGNKVQPININDFPDVKTHLDQAEIERAEIERRKKGNKKAKGLYDRLDQGVTPYNLRNCAYFDSFKEEKIIWSDISTKSNFSLVPAGYYIDNTSYMIVGSHLRYLLSVLNSNVCNFFFPMIATDLGKSGNRYFKRSVEKIPVPEIDSFNQDLVKKIEILCDQRVENADNEEIKIDVEKKINNLIYQLYDLNDEEISTIENSVL